MTEVLLRGAVISMLALVGCSSVTATESGGARSSGHALRDERGGVVATVGDAQIGVRDFRHWLGVFTGRKSLGRSLVPASNSPRLTGCFEASPGHSRGADVARDSRKPLERACRRWYRGLERHVMQVLIRAEWLEQEARDRGIELTREEVERRFERDIPDGADRDEALRLSGMSEPDVLFQLRFSLLQAEIFEDIKRRVVVSHADVRRYYERHRRQLREPFAEVAGTLRRVVTQDRHDKRLERFAARMQRKFRDETACAPDLVVPQCGSTTEAATAIAKERADAAS